MDSSRFDEFTKALARSTSRRQALKALAATLGGLLGLGSIGTAFANCKPNGIGSNSNSQCCSGAAVTVLALISLPQAIAALVVMSARLGISARMECVSLSVLLVVRSCAMGRVRKIVHSRIAPAAAAYVGMTLWGLPVIAGLVEGASPLARVTATVQKESSAGIKPTVERHAARVVAPIEEMRSFLTPFPIGRRKQRSSTAMV